VAHNAASSVPVGRALLPTSALRVSDLVSNILFVPIQRSHRVCQHKLEASWGNFRHFYPLGMYRQHTGDEGDEDL
jgi:hypothetical protein